MNHETLYLAVKITDHYLAVIQTKREALQLIGSTAMLIASKFEVRHMLSCDSVNPLDAFVGSDIIANHWVSSHS